MYLKKNFCVKFILHLLILLTPYIAISQNATVTGVALDCGTGMADLAVRILNVDFQQVAITGTIGDGTYSISDIPPGTYIVEFNGNMTDANSVGLDIVNDGTDDNDAADLNRFDYRIPVTLVADETDSGNNFYTGFASNRIFGRVRVDNDLDGLDDGGLPGVTVELFDNFENAVLDIDGNAVTAVSAGAAGSFSMINLLPGIYDLVQESVDGYTYDGVNSINVDNSKMAEYCRDDEAPILMNIDRRFDFGDMASNTEVAGTYPVARHGLYNDTDFDGIPDNGNAMWLGPKVDGEPLSVDFMYPSYDDNLDSDGDGIDDDYEVLPNGDDTNFLNDDDGLQIIDVGSPGGNAMVRIEGNSNTANSILHYGIWLDWDVDNEFDNFYNGSFSNGSRALTDIAIPIPLSYDANNQVNLRIRLFTEPLAFGNAGGNLFNGEVEDYRFLPSQILPVEYLSFAAERQDEDVFLTWETAMEENNDKFEVESSQDGVNFEKIGIVSGGGSDMDGSSYGFLHRNAFASKVNIIYYRLKQLDFNGMFEISQVISIRNGSESRQEDFTISNPVQVGDQINIIGKNIGKVMMYNSSGLLVSSENYDSSSQATLDTLNLGAGIYLLVVNESVTYRVVVQH